MTSVLDMPVDELLAALEAAVSRGNRRAERTPLALLAEEAETGELGVIARLSATPFVVEAGW